MSNASAIATVTTALAEIVRVAAQSVINGADVLTERPDATAITQPRIRLFLYQVSANAAMRNSDLPMRSADGRLVARPTVALDLHYLMAFYGNEKDLEPQKMLGAVVRDLHRQPMLPRSSLGDAIERVRFTPVPLSLDELSKLWSIFFQTPYALSIAYQGSVVLIESEDVPQPALPVAERTLSGTPFAQPAVDRLAVVDAAGDELPNQPIRIGSRVSIRGKGLRGDDTLVLMDGGEIMPDEATDTRILLPALPPQLPDGKALRAGVRGLQVVQRMPLGIPPQPHRVVTSAVFPFVLRPEIAPALEAGSVKIEFTPKVGRTQRVALILNELSAGSAPLPKAYRIDAPPDNGIPAGQDETELIRFPLSGVTSGTYLVRAQVDGAESILQRDANGAYSEPKVIIP